MNGYIKKLLMAAQNQDSSEEYASRTEGYENGHGGDTFLEKIVTKSGKEINHEGLEM